jgi:hypothetical protein
LPLATLPPLADVKTMPTVSQLLASLAHRGLPFAADQVVPTHISMVFLAESGAQGQKVIARPCSARRPRHISVPRSPSTAGWPRTLPLASAHRAGDGRLLVAAEASRSNGAVRCRLPPQATLECRLNRPGRARSAGPGRAGTPTRPRRRTHIAALGRFKSSPATARENFVRPKGTAGRLGLAVSPPHGARKLTEAALAANRDSDRRQGRAARTRHARPCG